MLLLRDSIGNLKNPLKVRTDPGPERHTTSRSMGRALIIAMLASDRSPVRTIMISQR
jgi:hypothetical protein